VPHTARPFVDGKNHPVHISTSIVPGLPSLRRRVLWSAVRKAFVYGCRYGEDRIQFRIVHYCVQGQHLHLICEAKNRRWLSRGIQGFKIRVARAINSACQRRGRVFKDRYHERVLTNPTQCRHAISYVLCNQRHHAYAEGASYPRGRVDPLSSALYFDGWTIKNVRPWANAPPTDTDGEITTLAPTTWLLRVGWRRGGGLISPDTIPGLPKNAPPLPVW